MNEIERAVAIVYTEACRRLLVAMRTDPTQEYPEELALCDAIRNAWPGVVEVLESGMPRPF